MSELFNLLSDLVAIDSVNPDLVPGGAGEGRMAAYIADWGRDAGLEVHVQEAAPERPNVVLIARGRGGGQSLMLNAHTDVVGVEGMAAPFKPVRRADRLYGRGAYDMKSGLAAAMLALKAARDMRLAGDVMLSAVIDEEYGSLGTEALLAEWQRWPADAVLIAEPTELAISIAHRGFVWLEIDTIGVAAHGSRPRLGVDAIAKMGAVLVALEAQDRAMRARPTHDLLGSGSLHASLINGGEEISMYPAHCKLQVERRTIPGESLASVEAEAQALLDELATADPDFKAGAKATFARGPFEIDRAHPLVRQLKGIAEARLNARCAAHRKQLVDGFRALRREEHPDSGDGPGRGGRARPRGMGRPGQRRALPGDLQRLHRRILPLRQLDIEAKIDHIAILHHIIAAFHLQQTGRTDGVAILVLLENGEGDDLGADETAFHVGMHDAGRLGRGPAADDGPGPRLVLVECEITDQTEQAVALADQLFQAALGQTIATEILGALLIGERRQFPLQTRADREQLRAFRLPRSRGRKRARHFHSPGSAHQCWRHR